jgi:hypothetical protein
MYVRKSIRSYNGRTYVNYVLVESVHTAKGPRQKTICSLRRSRRPRARGVAEISRQNRGRPCRQGDLLDVADAEVADISSRDDTDVP